MRSLALWAFALAAVHNVSAQDGVCDEDPTQLASYEGDGYCDELLGDFNTWACGWDGGDCCNSTCVDDLYTCGVVGFNCKDPNATDYNDGECTAAGEGVGDGYCDVYSYSNDLHLNKALCNWDGGDCCPSTCEGTCNHLVFDCLDPNATDFGTKSACEAPNPAWLADGYCDHDTVESDVYNTMVCGWDGGDCCSSTCVDGEFSCGSSTYVCRDTNASDYVNPDNCSVTFVHFLGDGYCDYSIYNVASCDWDGGDCCEDTCADGDYYCGTNNFDECLDPSSSLFVTASADTEIGENCIIQYPSYIGDAYCDHNAGYNTMACNWDGGDCCESSCLQEVTAYDCGVVGYMCMDPNATDFQVCAGANSSKFGDGVCDQYAYDLELHLNSEICDWDGGDCCPSTCVGTCSNVVYDCLDPDATDVGAVSECDVPSPSWIGDAYCDASSSYYNTAACAWDGGDCCEESCLHEDTPYECGTNSYVCLDPTYSDGSCQAPYSSWLSDGYCDDTPYNTDACNWDGGDCCPDTCTSTSVYTCGVANYDCQDPIPSCAANLRSYIGDGVCDFAQGPLFNTANCSWDGGDCCQSTCQNSSLSECGVIGYHCLDPDASNFAECPGKDSIYYSDGFCDMYRFDLDSYLNTDLCGWDGGDCCPSNCSMNGDSCDNYVYACMDPSAEDNGDFSSCAVASSSWVGDSVCDADSLGYNTAACGWDGGDCCESTCDGRNSAQCGEANYFCMDPDADETQVVDGECNVAYDSYLGDGACDPMDTYNTLACGWDGGDCCKSTCESTASTTCGDSGWLCLDPAGSNCAVDNPSYLGDGYCDAVEESHGYNTRGCNWDGGDCCISTCGTHVAVYGSLTFDCGSIGYNCVDPAAADYYSCAGITDVHFADGYCDMWHYDLSLHLNTAICNWDGGDCCPSTCVASTNSTGGCQLDVYDCLDPTASEFGESSACEVAAPSWIGDAYCDAGSDGYNTDVCNWDGGDCCQSTCLQEVTFYDCGHVAYACLDPDAEETQVTVPDDCEVTFVSWLADGYCDEASDNYNTDTCGWDGGDCCESSCVDGPVHSCGTSEYFCFNPEATDYDDSVCIVSYESYLGDGYCDAADDEAYNSYGCDWDGGDCCAATCGSDGTNSYTCGTVGYRCLDPDAADFAACPGNETVYFADGFCDMYNFDLNLHLNVAVCDWDGGDCCPSTCRLNGGDCPNNVYSCLDPDASDYTTTSACIVSAPSWIGDAYCDDSAGSYNTAVCGWDGGDCCEDSCLDEVEFYECGQVSYVCRDPESDDYAALDDCLAEKTSWLADGYCDFGDGYDYYNTAACNWDGGDCCEYSCADGVYTCGFNGYDCLDPGSDTTCEAEIQSYINDGYCDDYTYNNAACAWDGGDCCEIDCEDSLYTCGAGGYNCLDPAISSCEAEVLSYIADGYCDAIDGSYNNAACNWDGGDCCLATCEDSTYDCGLIGYVCNDPTASDYHTCNGLGGENWGNGECDMYHYHLHLHLNTDMCDWDGGDCCQATCTMPDGSECDNIVFDCLDPTAADYGASSNCTAAAPSWIGDGYCDNNLNADDDPEYNNPACSWDGGDCCADTCVEDTYDCTAGFYCTDPDSPDYGTNNGITDPGATDPTSDGNLLIIIIVVVVIVVVVVVVVVVIVVLKNKTKTVTADSPVRAAHQSRPTTMIQSVTVDDVTFETGASQGQSADI